MTIEIHLDDETLKLFLNKLIDSKTVTQMIIFYICR